MKDIFDIERLPIGLDELLREANPWWSGRPGRLVLPYRRWAFDAALKKLDSGLAPATVLRGPRQVGKTTLQEQLIDFLIHERHIEPSHVLRVQFDELPPLRDLKLPILDIVRWYQNRILHRTLNEAAHEGQPAYLFFDEVQNLPDWAPQIKSLADHHTVKVAVTGSSALRIEAGRDSLAGRISQVSLGTLLLREIAGLRFGVTLDPVLPPSGLEALLRADFWRELQEHGVRHRDERDQAFVAFSERGGYPVAQASHDVPWPELAEQLNETVIERSIQHDLRLGARGRRRDPQLLEEVYRLACRYAGQAPGRAVFVPELQQALDASIGWQRVQAYLDFLDAALLLRLIPPLELRPGRARSSRKICLCDHALRASWLHEVVPLDPHGLRQAPHLSEAAGHIAESVVGYYLSDLPHLGLAHLPERRAEPEVGFVLTIGERRIPLEVKYRARIDPHADTLGLRAFLDRPVYNAPFGILVTMHDGVELPDPRLIPVSLPSLLLLR